MTASPPSDPWAPGQALLRAGQAEAAEAFYRPLLPHPEASLGVARALHLRGLHSNAWPFYRAAIAALADPLAAQIDAAGSSIARGEPGFALEILRFSRPIPPVLRLRSAALLRLDRLDEVLDVTARWLAAAPDDPHAWLDRAHALLALGRFDAGWAAYEHRWQLLDNAQDWHSRAVPLWHGEAGPAGQTLLVHAEQGLGDTLHFVRYLPLLRPRFKSLILQVQPPLLRLLRGQADHVVTEDPPPHDLHIPLMSLPFALGITAPPPVPPATEPGQWASRLAALPGQRVGIAWTGSAPPGGEAQNQRRSLPPALLERLALPGITLISLQKDHPAPPGMIDWTAELHDFADTANLVAGLDLVISVDTAVAHLAGTLGRPVWLLNRFDSCWRWLRGRDDSPWYPSLRQFRQPAPGDWDTPLSAVIKALQA